LRAVSARVAVRTKTPFLLFRFPSLFVAVAAAAFVLGLAASSVHLFLSSVGSAALREEIRGTDAATAGLSVTGFGPVAPDRLAYRTGLLDRATRGLPELGRMVSTVIDETPVEIGPRPARFGQGPFVRFATRTGFRGHLSIVEGRRDAPGWWVPLSAARRLGVHAGEIVHVDAGSVKGLGFVPFGPQADLRVAGVYRDLATQPLTSYWAPIGEEIVMPGADEFPPAFLLGDRSELMRVERRFAGDGVFRWERPASGVPLSMSSARSLGARLERMAAAFEDPATQLGTAFASGTTILPTLVQGARGTIASVRAPIDAVAVAGRLVAIGLFLAAGLFGVSRRGVEFAALEARGVSPFGVGARVAVECILPAALGAAVGWLAAVAAVGTVGPSRLVDATAPATAAVDTGATLAVALVVLAVGVAVALRGSRGAPAGRLRRLLARVPWEAPVLLLAAASLYEIRTRGVPPVQGGVAPGRPPAVDVLVPLFPLLFVAGAGGLGVRALRALLPRVRARSARWPAPIYLAVRRLAAANRPAVLLVTFGVVSVGTLVYAGVFVTSVRATTSEKALLSVGSDAAISLGGVPTLPRRLGGPATEVLRFPVSQVGSDTNVAVIAVDPNTFARAAFWDASLAGGTPAEVRRELSARPGDRVPVLVAGGALPSTFSLRFVATEIPARVVHESAGFAGMPPDAPLVVASQPGLRRVASAQGATLADLSPAYEVWVRGPVRPVLHALGRAGVLPTGVVTAAGAARSPGFLATSWLFGFLETLSFTTAVLALVATLLYVQARQGAREVSYALASRMGLDRRSHRRSVVAELSGMLIAAFSVGSVVALLGALVVQGDVDPVPQLAPALRLHLPWTLLGAIAVTLLGFAWAAAVMVQRRADRADVAEVMRVAA
jgi:putative ABC transport system permease protein